MMTFFLCTECVLDNILFKEGAGFQPYPADRGPFAVAFACFPGGLHGFPLTGLIL